MFRRRYTFLCDCIISHVRGKRERVSQTCGVEFVHVCIHACVCVCLSTPALELKEVNVFCFFLFCGRLYDLISAHLIRCKGTSKRIEREREKERDRESGGM